MPILKVMDAKLLDKLIKDFRVKRDDVLSVLGILSKEDGLNVKIDKINQLKIRKKDKIIVAISTVLFDDAMTRGYANLVHNHSDNLSEWSKKTPTELRNSILEMAFTLQRGTSVAPPKGKLNIFMLLIY